MADTRTIEVQGATCTFHNQDCIEGMQGCLAEHSVDVIVTSRP